MAITWNCFGIVWMMLVSWAPTSCLVGEDLLRAHPESLHLASVVSHCLHGAVLSENVETLRLVPVTIGATATDMRFRTLLGCYTLAIMILAMNLVLRVI